MKHLTTIAAAMLLFGVFAEDTDCGALITTGNIADSAKVENLTGANAGKATITINNNSGTANSVTVYNAATIDTALSGKATTGDVTALQNRATALETATNNLTTAVATAQSSAESAYVNSTNYTARGYLPLTGGTLTGTLNINGGSFRIADTLSILCMDALLMPAVQFGDNTITFPYKSGEFALTSDIVTKFPYTAITNAPWITTETDPTVPTWAKAQNKPSYNFSEIGSKPTTIAGYGITDAKISNGTITLGSNSITPLTSFTESDPVWTAEKSGYVQNTRTVAGMALTDNITLKNLSIVGSSTTTYNGSAAASVNQTTATLAAASNGGTSGKNLTIAVATTSVDFGAYYIKIGSDGKPHLMLRK